MKRKIITATLIVMSATLAQAIHSSVATGNWTNTATWSQGSAPGIADVARIKDGYTVTVDTTVAPVKKVQVGGGTLKVNSGGSLTGTDLDFGYAGGAVVLVDGGTLVSGNTVKVGNTSDTGQLTVNNDGTLSFGGNFFVGAKNNDGSVTLNSGSITALNLTLGDADTATTARFDLLSGSMTLTSGALNIASFGSGSSLLNIESDAQMILGGEKDISAFVGSNITWANGNVLDTTIGDTTWSNGSGSYLHSAFDGTDTTVWVNETIPEPATLGLISMTGIAILFIRKRLQL